jgi:hypothetical protein
MVGFVADLDRAGAWVTEPLPVLSNDSLASTARICTPADSYPMKRGRRS